MIRATLLVHSMRLGGTEVQVSALARGLDRSKITPTVVSFHDDGALLAELRDADVPVVTVGKNGRGDAAGLIWRVIKAIRMTRPDVVYSFLDLPNVVAASARILGACPRVVWGLRATDMRMHERVRSWRINFALERRLVGRADLIICNSWAGRDYLVGQAFPQDKITIVPNGIDTRRFAPRAPVRERLRTELGLAEDEFVIGLVARLDPIKDHRGFLHAANLLSKRRPHARFVLVGDGPEEHLAPLRQLAAELDLQGRIVWAGQRSDIQDVYSAFDLSTLTSLSEGFPNVVSESMACGLPCVVTDVGDAARVVGPTGSAVAAGDTEALAGAWESFVAMPKSQLRKLGTQARERVKTLYPTEAMISHSTRCLQQVVHGQIGGGVTPLNACEISR